MTRALETFFITRPLGTLAHSLSFMLYKLLKRPNPLHRARTEADPLFERGEPTVQGYQLLAI